MQRETTIKREKKRKKELSYFFFFFLHKILVFSHFIFKINYERVIIVKDIRCNWNNNKKKGRRKKKNIGKYKEIILFIFSRGVHYTTCNSMISISFKVFSTIKNYTF